MQSFDKALEVFFLTSLMREELCLCWMNIKWRTSMAIDDMDELRHSLVLEIKFKHVANVCS